MTFKFAMAASAALLTTAAMATGPGNLGVLDNDTRDIGNTILVDGNFSDVYSFDLNNPGTFAGVVSSRFLTQFGIVDLSASLNGGSLSDPLIFGEIVNGTRHLVDFEASGLTGGHYTLTISGMVFGGKGSYGGNVVAETAPVPEAEPMALALAGLSVLGLLTRRRQRN